MNTLTCSLAAVCQARLLDEKWLVAPSLRVGHQWLEAVARSGQPALNCHVKTLKSMAIDLAAPFMTRQGAILASPRGCALLLDRAYREVRGQLKYLSGLEPSTGLAETILRSIEAIRLAGLDLSEADERQFEVARKGEDLRRIFAVYRRLQNQAHLVDHADVLQLACARIKEEPECLPPTIVVLIPQDVDCVALEKRLLASLPKANYRQLATDATAAGPADADTVETDRELLRWLMQPADAPKPAADGSVQIFRAIGEVNEIRNVLRQCLAGRIPWDEVELLHTDVRTYVPLVFETLAALDFDETEADDDLPVTFTEGIPCRYSRPGRALLAWLRWIEDGFSQALLINMLKEGLLAIPDADQGHSGFTRLAALLRGAGIGLGRERYLPKLAERFTAVENRLNDTDSGGNEHEAASRSKDSRKRDLHDLKTLESLVRGLLETTPDRSAPSDVLIRSAKRFVESCARSISKLDRFATQQLTNELIDMEHWLGQGDARSGLGIWEWLETLPTETRVLGSGPRPACLHVDSIWGGGHSGRPHTFIVGLDDTRFPGAGLQDPLLLDQERRRLSAELPTAAARLQDATGQFARLLARLRGRVTMSFACQSLTDDREMFPSSVLLSVFRLLTGDATADQDALLAWLPPPAAFSPAAEGECLDMAEWWLWRLTEPESIEEPDQLVFSQFPHLKQGRLAAAERDSPNFTAFDGLVPQAVQRLDPTSKDGPVMSSSRLQTIATCPRRFFFQFGLDIEAPDDISTDPNTWLDPLAAGSLLHELFERFMQDLIDRQQVPVYARDCARLKQLLDEKIAQYKELYPPPSVNAFEKQLRHLQTTAETFLREEEEFCCRRSSVPVYPEASLGLRAVGRGTPLDTLDPISIELSGGRAIRVRGRVDRIDRVGPPGLQTYAIWDYKTGSTWGYEKSDPFQQGRRIQPYIYITMVTHRLRQAVSADAKVSYFGFFFPGIKAVGERMEWTPQELSNGKQIIEELCQIVAGGTFIATNNADDCTFCDYTAICGDPKVVARLSNAKLTRSANSRLSAFHSLRCEATD